MPPTAVRTAKIILVGCVGMLGLLVGVDNILDYRTNFEVVRHVMSMDAIPPGSPLMWRAITNPSLHWLAYAIIIAAELLFGALCLFGAARLVRADSSFESAKGPAVAGLALGFALYFFGFLIVGGEWFQMWQAGPWNMQEPAFRFVGSIGLILIFLCLP